MAVKSYNLPKGLFASGVFFLGFMTAIPLLVTPLIVRTMIDPRTQGIEPGFQQYAIGTIYLGYMLGMAVAWTHLLRGLVRQIDVHADSTLEFKTRLGRTVLTPGQIRSIELVTTEDGIATHITHAKGRLSISEQMGDMSELVSFLKSRNPRIEVTRAAS